MGNLYVQETYVNETKGYRCGESEVYETFTDKPGRLFRDMQREYGRCVSSMYIDGEDGNAQRIGWVFRKRMEYEDYRGHGERYYVREVWVSVHERKPEVEVREFLATL